MSSNGAKNRNKGQHFISAKPSELRDKLLKLHGKAHNNINEYDCDTDLGMFDLAWEIEEDIFDAIRYLEDIQKMINDLTELCPSEEDEWEDEDDDKFSTPDP